MEENKLVSAPASNLTSQSVGTVTVTGTWTDN